MKTIVYSLIVLFNMHSVCRAQNPIPVYDSDNLKILQLTPRTFIHISNLYTEQYGKVGCNGLVVIDEMQAIVLDTPTNDTASLELINWIEETNSCQIHAVVPMHFHQDCIGGIGAFHKKGIPSYANEMTQDIVKQSGGVVAQFAIDTTHEFHIGKEKVILVYLGEGHTKDNLVGFFPGENVLFGGCLVKAIGAGKGNLNDANVEEWANTVQKIQSRFGSATVIVPGHGPAGGTALLDYTIQLFGGRSDE